MKTLPSKPISEITESDNLQINSACRRKQSITSCIEDVKRSQVSLQFAMSVSEITKNCEKSCETILHVATCSAAVCEK